MRIYRNTLPRLFLTIPPTSCPPIPPKPKPRMFPLEKAELAHRFCASRSAYVKPSKLDRLNTNARRTIGRKLGLASSLPDGPYCVRDVELEEGDDEKREPSQGVGIQRDLA